MRRTIKSREQWSTFTLTPAFSLFPSVEIHPPQNPRSFLRAHPLLFLSINSGVNFSRCDWGSVSRSFSSEQMGAVNFCGLHTACVRVKSLMSPRGVRLAWLYGVCDCMTQCHTGSPFKHHTKETRFKTPEMAFYWLHRTQNHIFKAVLHKWCETSKHISHGVASCAWCEKLRENSICCAHKL